MTHDDEKLPPKLTDQLIIESETPSQDVEDTDVLAYLNEFRRSFAELGNQPPLDLSTPAKAEASRLLLDARLEKLAAMERRSRALRRLLQNTPLPPTTED